MSMISIFCGTTTTSTNLPMQTKVDFFIVATDRQRNRQFAKYTNHQPISIPIPVGSLASLPQNENRTPFSMIAHFSFGDKEAYWLVASSGSRQKELPELSFWHLWKRWRREGKLRSLIDELGSRLYPSQGHANLEEQELWGFTCQHRPKWRLWVDSDGKRLVLDFQLSVLTFLMANQTFVTEGKMAISFRLQQIQVVDQIAAFCGKDDQLYKKMIHPACVKHLMRVRSWPASGRSLGTIDRREVTYFERIW